MIEIINFPKADYLEEIMNLAFINEINEENGEENGVKSFLLTNLPILLILLYGQTIKNPISGSVLPRHLSGKRAKGDIFRH